MAVGRAGQRPEAALFAAWNRRLRPPLELVELPEGRGSPGEIRAREAAAILAALPERALVVALDPAGISPDTEGLARLIEGWRAAGRPLVFVIGGAEGLDPSVLARAEVRLSLGPLTWPHLLVRAMLVDQLYRAQCLRQGHPYHRGGRG